MYCFLFVAVVVAGCSWACDLPEKAAEESATSLLLGRAEILPNDEKVMFVDSSGHIGDWEGLSGNLRIREIDARDTTTLEVLRQKKTLLLVARGASQASSQQKSSLWSLMVVSQRTLDVENRFPFGSCISMCSPDSQILVAAVCDEAADAGDSKLRGWRLSKEGLAPLGEYTHAQGTYNTSDVAAVSSDQVLAIVEPSVTHEEDGTGNVLLLHVPSWRVISSAKLSGFSEGEWWRVRVSRNGRHAAVFDAHHIEIFDLPKLGRRTVTLAADMPSPDHLAISSDGEYVVFGSSSLAVWCANDNMVHLLDPLNARLVNARLTIIHPELKGMADLPSIQALAIQQYLLADVAFLESSGRVAGITHDGVYSVWDVATRKRLLCKRIAAVQYVGVPANGPGS